MSDGGAANAPAGTAPAPAPTDFEGPSRWVTASTEVRKTAQWTATALAAVGGVVFGAGPVIARSELDASAWPVGRIVLSILAAVIGVMGLTVVIGSLVKAQVPTELTLSTLPQRFRERVNADPLSYLPSGAASLADFQLRSRAYKAAAARLSSQIRRETDEARQQELSADLATATANVATYEARRASLLAQAQFEAASARLSSSAKPIAFGSALAVAGAVLYLLLVSGKPADEATDTGAAGAAMATLMRGSSGQSDELWRRLGLERCGVGSADSVPVLKTAGKGTSSDPYLVETLGFPAGCPRLAFSVVDDVAGLVVEQPAKHTISYQPKAED